MEEQAGNKEQLTTYLHGLKGKMGWTVSQWEAASGVPKQTISRLLQGQVESPQFRTVALLVIAANGSLDEMVGIEPQVHIEKEYIKSPESQQLIDKGQRSIDYLKNQLEIMQVSNAKLQRRITVCHVLLCLFLFVFGLLLAWDLIDPRYGFVYRVMSDVQQNGSWIQRVTGIICQMIG